MIRNIIIRENFGLRFMSLDSFLFVSNLQKSKSIQLYCLATVHSLLMHYAILSTLCHDLLTDCYHQKPQFIYCPLIIIHNVFLIKRHNALSFPGFADYHALYCKIEFNVKHCLLRNAKSTIWFISIYQLLTKFVDKI